MIPPVGGVLDKRRLQPSPTVLGYLSGRQVGLSTGLQGFDRRLRGLQGLVCVMGEPKVNKSTLVLQWLLHHAEGGGVSYYLDFENGAPLFTQRILCALWGKDARQLAETSEAEKVAALERFNASRQFYYCDEPLGLEDFTAEIELLLATTDKQVMVAIDSVQWIKSKQADKRLRIEEWVAGLDMLKLKHRPRLTIVCISEKNRPNYRTASAAGAKESGAIEYKAEQLFDLQHATEDGEEGQLVRMTCVANRHGPKGWSVELEPVMARAGDNHSFTFKMRESVQVGGGL